MQEMTPEQRLRFDTDNYRKKLEANKGSNYEYWKDKHDKLLENGYDLYEFVQKSTIQYSARFKKFATSSEHHAQKAVEQLRESGNYARIICGYEKNRQRLKMYSVIYKPKDENTN